MQQEDNQPQGRSILFQPGDRRARIVQVIPRGKDRAEEREPGQRRPESGRERFLPETVLKKGKRVTDQRKKQGVDEPSYLRAIRVHTVEKRAGGVEIRSQVVAIGIVVIPN